MRKVVITGMGAVTPIGIGKEKYWEALISGKSGVSTITQFDAGSFPVKIAAEVKNFIAENYLEKKEIRKTDRFTQFAIATTKEAISDANLIIDKENSHLIGVIIGTGIGGLSTIEEAIKLLLSSGHHKISPFTIPKLISDAASGMVSICFGIKGPSNCTVTACSSSAHAIADAYEIIKRGDAEVMITGGAEACITPLAVSAFSAMGALSKRNEEPEKASRPFDSERDGFVIGEGCGVLILENEEYALKRGTKIYSDVIGYGLSSDAYHITAPDPEGEGAVRCMEIAIKKAGIRYEEVDYINAHGTSTSLNDVIETKAIKKLFKEHSYKILINSNKSMIGHCLGAAGALELIASLLTLKYGIIPPTINLENPDPGCDLNYVPNKAIKKEIKVALSNSFAFFGHNVSILIKKR